MTLGQENWYLEGFWKTEKQLTYPVGWEWESCWDRRTTSAKLWLSRLTVSNRKKLWGRNHSREWLLDWIPRFSHCGSPDSWARSLGWWRTRRRALWVHFQFCHLLVVWPWASFQDPKPQFPFQHNGDDNSSFLSQGVAMRIIWNDTAVHKTQILARESLA